MNLLKVSPDRFLNMDLLIEAEFVTMEGIQGGPQLVMLRFAGPWEQAVFRHDDAGHRESTVVPFEVALRGEGAALVRAWLDRRTEEGDAFDGTL